MSQRGDLAALEGALGQARARAVPSLEELFTHEDYFGVETATPLQRAICRIADGRPAAGAEIEHALSSWTDPEKRWDGRPFGKPRELVLLAGTRSGKTRLSCAQAVRLALTCACEGLKPGERPRVPIVSLSLDLAAEAYSQLTKTLLERPRLRGLLLEEPTASKALLRHPSGRAVEIVVTAGKRAGSSLVARWLAGCIFDEAPRMMSAFSGAAVNLTDMLSAIQSRLLPGAQVLEIGSPWAPMGEIYSKVLEHHGRPSASICVVRARGPALNPVWWTPELQEKLRSSPKGEDQLSYRTDCLAEWIDSESGLISAEEVQGASRSSADLPSRRVDGVQYVAAIDPAARMNAWTLGLKHRTRGRDIVDLVRQWHRPPGGSLDPDQVLGEIAKLLAGYGCTLVASDKWEVNTLRALAGRHGLRLIEYDFGAQELASLYLELATKVATKAVELPADALLRQDLLSARKRATQGGMVIDLPVTAGGRHCDYVPMLARLLRMPVQDTLPPEKPKLTDEQDMLARAKKRYAPERKRAEHWWQKDPTAWK